MERLDPRAAERRVAVLADCDNIAPDALEHALEVATRFGRVVLRRGYGNSATLAHKWQETLVRLAFTPCLQYQYASGKNTSDIALALDALEALFDARADTFCLVTSDSDFACVCRKLRERGARVCIVGEGKTPEALRNASDEFFEWKSVGAAPEAATAKAGSPVPASAPKGRPQDVVAAVGFLAARVSEGRVGLSALGEHLKRSDPGFSPKNFGHAGLLRMVKSYLELSTAADSGAHWVSMKPKGPKPKGPKPK